MDNTGVIQTLSISQENAIAFLFMIDMVKDDPNILQKMADAGVNVGSSSRIVEASPLLLNAIRRGLGYKAACAYAGIAYQTFLNWRQAGEDELTRLENSNVKPDATKIGQVIFVKQLQEAKGQGEFTLADVIYNAAVGGGKVTNIRTVQTLIDGQVVKEEVTVSENEISPDWKAAALLLERRNKGWQRKQSTEITGADGGPIKSVSMGLNLNGMSPDELDNIIHNLIASTSGDADPQSD